MANGTLSVGSRTPVAVLPAWVTPEVIRGGFVTGAVAAGGPLQPYEVEVAHRVGIPVDRRALFAYYLTEPGLAELLGMLDTGRYRIDVPEQAALPAIAWLARNGDRLGSLALVETVAPFADRLRFAPAPTTSPAADPAIVHRETAGQVRDALAARRPNPRVEAMREALAVWGAGG